ncbi:MAG: AraC family transcriptional regulator [Pseudomonadales bacterium]|nr:AraC family transcriptional regulator [Pseudomonadales bacterium]
MSTSTAHHIKGLRPALLRMKELGFSELECLQGTGIQLEKLEQADQSITPQQEFQFYRRTLELSQDPLIGLELGKGYRVEYYGVFGYAILSAKTFGKAMELVGEFGSALSFSQFSVGFEIMDGLACFHLSKDNALDPDLLQLYCDRDLSGFVTASQAILSRKLPLRDIRVMHDGENYRQCYETFAGCPVKFNHERTEIRFDLDILDSPLPLRDPETSEYCRQQCQQLLDRLTEQNSLVNEVRTCLLSQLGSFPTITEVAHRLNIPERSIRRKLSEKGSSYQVILNEIRYELAKDYLQTELSLERIADMLGYSEVANFSHAFKRWSQVSPKTYRQRKSRI